MNRRLLAVALLAAVLLGAAWYGLAYRSENKRLSALRQQGAQVQSQVTTLSDQVVALERAARQVPRDRLMLSELEAAVPDNPRLDQIVAALYGLARRAGTVVTQVQTAEPAPFGGGLSPAATSPQPLPTAVDLTLNVTGDAGQVMKLVGLLESQARLFVVTGYTLQFNVSQPAPAAGVPAGRGGNGSTVAAGSAGTSIQLVAWYADAASASPA